MSTKGLAIVSLCAYAVCSFLFLSFTSVLAQSDCPPHHIFTGAAAGDSMGSCVAGAGDVNNDGYDDLIVGAPRNDATGTDAGQAYVYSGLNGIVLFTFNGEAVGDNFGASVSGAGDVNGDGYDDVVVGAPGNDAGGTGAGRVYIYAGSDGTGLMVLRILTGAAGDSLGAVVADAGDVSGDGRDEIVMAATGYGGLTGRVYVYSHVAGAVVWTFTGEAAGDRFGAAIDGNGDWNADGYPDVIVGAPYNDAVYSNGGRAYVYSGQNGSLLQRWAGEHSGDFFGCAVAIGGDYSPDVVECDVLVGAYGFDENIWRTDAGHAYLYRGSDAGLVREFYGGGASDFSGFSVSFADDYTLLGRDVVVIGMPGDDSTGTDAGAVRVYHASPDVWPRMFHGESAGDRFGSGVAGVHDINADGYGDFIAGAPGSDSAASGAGRSYVFTCANSAQQISGEFFGDLFGSAVAGGRDVNNDGFDDYVIGAPNNDAVASNAGRVYVYSGLTSSVLHTFSGISAGDKFGTTVALIDDVNADGNADILVGAPYVDGAFADAGATYIYSGQTGTHLRSTVEVTASAYGGLALSSSRDIDDDGVDDYIVSSPGRGMVYVSSGASGDLLHILSATAYAVAGPGDVDEDGIADIVTSNKYWSSGRGTMALFSGATGLMVDSIVGYDLGDSLGIALSDFQGHSAEGVWLSAYQKSYGDQVRIFGYVSDVGRFANSNPVQDPTAETTHSWGWSLSGSADFNGDGWADQIVGSPLHDSGGIDAGAVYVFSGKPYGSNYAMISCPVYGTAPWDRVGASVSDAGDINGDGFDEFIVGAPQPGSGSGKAYVISQQTAAPTVTVSVATAPLGRSFSVDGVTYSTPQVFNWVRGSSHTIATTAGQLYGSGQYAWTSWSDGGAISHTVSPTSTTSYMANFTMQYYLTMVASPTGGGTLTPASGWQNASSSVQITALPNGGYGLVSWTGSGTGSYTGTNNPASVTMSGPITQTATFSLTIPITVQTSPLGRGFKVDNTTYTSTQVFTWIPGSTHTISTETPQAGGTGVQYVWTNWSDGGAISHTVAPTGATTYTANFTKQYYLTMAASPGAGGTANPASGWQNAETVVPIQAVANGGYALAGWTGTGTGSYTGTNNPASVIMQAPISQTANFGTAISVTVQTSPSGRSFTVDGSSYSSPQTFTWASGTSHAISTSTPQSGGEGTQYVWANWSDGGAIAHTVSPTTAITYTANFTTQHFLTMTASPGIGGNVSPGNGWHNAASTVPIQATPSGGYTFANWTGSGSGSYTGTNNPASITMSAPIAQTANFSAQIFVNVETSPSGLAFTVDGVPYSSSQMFTWISGYAHTIATSSPQAAGAGTQYVWTNWSDAGAISHTVTPTANTTFTANFTKQYYLTIAANPGAGGTVSPGSGWQNATASVPIQGFANEGYAFTGWVGAGPGSYTGTDNPATILMDAPMTQTANFGAGIAVTVQTSPSGRDFTVDGTPYSSTQLFAWTAGTTHTITTPSPQSGGTGIQYVWANWSDGGGRAHSVAPTVPTTYTANFVTQFYLTMTPSPGAGGTVTPASGWQNAAAVVPIQATANGGYLFGGWIGTGSGSFTGTTNPTSVTMNAPINETAHFGAPIAVTVQTSPAGRSITVDGAPYTSPQSFTWASGSSHTIATMSPQSGGTGTQYAWAAWSDGGGISHTVSPTTATTYTATFGTQYYLTMTSNPLGGGTLSPGSGWYDAAANVGISATANGGYIFNGWVGSGPGSYTGMNNPASVVVSEPITQTANFGAGIVVVVQTSPPDRDFTVDGTPYSSPQSFTWAAGSSHTVSTPTPQSGPAGTQYVWANWSDGGARTHTVTPSLPTTYTATFGTQYYLTMQATPGAGGIVTPASGWQNAAAVVAIEAIANEGYALANWTGSGSGSYNGTSNPATVTMNEPITEAATFGTAISVTVTAWPIVPSFTVDGVTFNSTQVFTWATGTSHTIATTSPQPGTTGIQYVWANWSDGGAMSHAISPTSAKTYTTYFWTQYHLSLLSNPPSAGTVTPASGWFNSGTVVPIEAVPDDGFAFTTWSGQGLGCYIGTNNPASVTMFAPVTETAYFGFACDCDCHCDPSQCDGLQDVTDVVLVVNVSFRGAAAIPDPNPACPYEGTDTNCSGSTDVVDVVKMVNVAFRGANPATEFCDPCP